MTEKNVKFKHMKDGDKEDYLLLQKYEEKYVSLTYERIIEELTRQGKNTMAVSYTHLTLPTILLV